MSGIAMVSVLSIAVRLFQFQTTVCSYKKKKNAYATWRTLCSRDTHSDHVTLFIMLFLAPSQFLTKFDRLSQQQLLFLFRWLRKDLK